MKKTKRNTILGVSLIIGFIVFWTVLFMIYKPDELIKDIGITNIYWVAFLVALLGAFSSLTTLSIYPLLVVLAAGGADPLLLGSVAGLGLTIGDLIFFFFGIEAGGLTSQRFKQKLHKLMDWVKEKQVWVLPVIIYLYVGFTPFPNNLLTGYLALMEFSWLRLVLPLALGNFTLPIIAALLAKDIMGFFM